MFKIGDKVKVQVLGYRLTGEIVHLDGEDAIVQVIVYYGKHNQQYIMADSKVKDLWKVIVDFEDWKKTKGM